MCDEGYTWAEDDQLSCVSETTEDYNVGHSTITYILNDDLEPTVAWTGDNWLVEDFTLMSESCWKRNNSGNTTEVVPSFHHHDAWNPHHGGRDGSVRSLSNQRRLGAKEEKARRYPQHEAVVA